MDIQDLLTETKARFNHTAAKAYLTEKYKSKLLVADQGGLWKANKEIIAFLHTVEIEQLVIIDEFDNPVKVQRKELLDKLQNAYNEVMNKWYEDWCELEQKR